MGVVHCDLKARRPPPDSPGDAPPPAPQAYLHRMGVVHCDLKPANVLLKSSSVDRRGFTAKVSDFGLSRWASFYALLRSRAPGGMRGALV